MGTETLEPGRNRKPTGAGSGEIELLRDYPHPIAGTTSGEPEAVARGDRES